VREEEETRGVPAEWSIPREAASLPSVTVEDEAPAVTWEEPPSPGGEPALLEAGEVVTVPATAPEEGVFSEPEARREAQEQEAPEEQEEASGAEMALDEAAKSALYAGEIELALAPPVDPALLARLYSRLLSMADMRILRTVGSWDSGSTINLLLERPQPLLSRLLEIPEVRIIPEPTGGARRAVSGALGGRGGQADRVWIALRG
jgi:hypothetical protein